MENVIEVRYAGVVVGRSTKVRDWNAAGAFIGFAEPLPSGTPLVLRGDGVEQAARVVEVFESANLAVAGMRVKFVGAAEAPRAAPRVAATPKPAPSPVPAPVVAPEPAPPVAVAPAAAPVVVAGATAPEEPAPVEAPGGSPSSVATEPAGSAGADHGDGDAGHGGGKRRRRRR